MRRILMALLLIALLAGACGGDDDDAGGGFGAPATDELGDQEGDASDGGFGASDDGEGGGDRLSSDPDGDLADFPIPSPPGALDAVLAELDGTRSATAFYPADRFDEIADAYEAWFLDQGLIDEPVQRVTEGQLGIRGTDGTTTYQVIMVVGDDGEMLATMTVLPEGG